ncbi:MAG: PAS domain S-box protein [Candidatus Acidoferrales bacterium]
MIQDNRSGGLAKDIAGHKAAEEKFKGLLEVAPDAMLIVNDEGEIVLVNAQTEQLFGYGRQELLGQPAQMLLPEPLRSRRGEGWAHYFTQPQVPPTGVCLELYGLRKDAARFPMEISLSPLKTEQGVLVSCAIRDVTDRKRKQKVARGQTATLRKMLNALTAKPELDTFLAQVITAVNEQLGAHTTRLWFHDKECGALYVKALCQDGCIVPVARTGLPTESEPLSARTLPWWQELVGTRHPVVVRVDDPTADVPVFDRDSLLARGLKTLLRVPLLLGEEVVGWLTVLHVGVRHYLPEEIELAQVLANHVTLALQLTQLAEERRQSAILQERNRIAGEIHDTLAQGFTGIVIQLEAAEDVLPESPEEVRTHIIQARSLARESLAEARRSVWALRPQALEEGDLASAFMYLANQLTAGTLIQVEFSLRGTPCPLPLSIEHDLLRIGQEALTNALRYAQVTKVRMELRFEPQQVRLCVYDDGRGFDPSQPTAHGFGLTCMRARAERIGAQLQVDSRPRKGTRITVTVPSPPAIPLSEVP